MGTVATTPELNVKLLQDSLKAVSHKGDQLVSTFYDTLFERYPGVRPLFDSVRMPDQKDKLLRSIVLVVRNLEKPEVLVPYLQGLGRMHIAYGTQEPHYDAVGECLLVALEKVAGPLWSDDLHRAWADAYAAVATLMKQGAKPYLA